MTRARFHRTRTRWINRAHSPAALAAVCVLTITSPKSLRRSSEAKALSKIVAARSLRPETARACDSAWLWTTKS